MKLDTISEIHLEWMFENQPELVVSLFKEDKLEDHLQRKLDQAILVEERQKESGLSQQEALQVAVETILAPADGPALMNDPPPEPVPLKLQERIWKRLEAIDRLDRIFQSKNRSGPRT